MQPFHLIRVIQYIDHHHRHHHFIVNVIIFFLVIIIIIQNFDHDHRIKQHQHHHYLKIDHCHHHHPICWPFCFVVITALSHLLPHLLWIYPEYQCGIGTGWVGVAIGRPSEICVSYPVYASQRRLWMYIEWGSFGIGAGQGGLRITSTSFPDAPQFFSGRGRSQKEGQLYCTDLVQ